MFLRRLSLRTELFILFGVTAVLSMVVFGALSRYAARSLDIWVVGIPLLLAVVAAGAGWFIAGRLARELNEVTAYAHDIVEAEPSGELEQKLGSSREVTTLRLQLDRVRSRVAETTETLSAARTRAEALARENEALYKIEKRVSEGAGQVSRLADRLASSLVLEELTEIALIEMMTAVGCEKGLLVIRPDGGSMVTARGIEVDDGRAKLITAHLWSLTEVVRATKGQLAVWMSAGQGRRVGGVDMAGSLVVPLCHSQGCNGFVILLQGGGNELAGVDIGLANSLARFAAIAIENANLFAMTKRASDEAEVVLNSSMWITESISSREIIRRLMEASMDLTKRHAGLLIWRRPGRQARVAASWDPHGGLEDRIKSRALRRIASVFDKAAVFSHPTDIQLDRLPSVDSRQEEFDLLARHGMSYATAIPLALRGKPAGSFWLFGSEPIAKAELSTIVTLANIAVTALENARSYERKHRISEILQRSLLPIRLPEIEGAGLDVFYASSTEEAYVGGDFYDVIKLADGTFALLLGDVCGKGVAAAKTSALVKEICGYLLLEHFDPASVLAEANKAVYSRTGRGAFVTAFLARLDITSGKVWFANAGHPPGLVVRRQGGVELLSTGDIVLGALQQYAYKTATASLGRGDKLVAYSDGVTEARHGKELFGEERLIEVARTLAGVTVRDFVSGTKEAVSAFAGGKLSDDIAILVCERLESESRVRAA